MILYETSLDKHDFLIDQIKFCKITHQFKKLAENFSLRNQGDTKFAARILVFQIRVQWWFQKYWVKFHIVHDDLISNLKVVLYFTKYYIGNLIFANESEKRRQKRMQSFHEWLVSSSLVWLISEFSCEFVLRKHKRGQRNLVCSNDCI